MSFRFAAVGDSFTEGVGDPRPNGTMRGWADLVAEGLATARGEAIGYANVAVRGRLLAPIVDDQLAAVLALDPPPTLVTLNGGGNDMLRPHCDVSLLRDRTEEAILACAASGVRLVLLSGPDPSGRLPFGSAIGARGAELTAMLAGLATAHDVEFVDLFHTMALRHPGFWSSDRIHLNPVGHRRVAAEVLTALVDATPEVPSPPAGSSSTPWDAVTFGRDHLLPWVIRHVRGRSSGDLIEPKHDDWAVIGPATPA
ncbi:SGNH/GDSL hydrolase family protein [Gordonia sp. NB41Y]|uniref:SGNH/GDSL hydrolase family protein n=1 Tax=Gordonia sp. NB41Y TaxID=875808 RepID=UPI0006B1A6C8|nr:SGNH/GDSL hydrolase family protein [Gordonia sp. NB41Y]EMP10403.2 GDSL family lipase [Gordonia sp. NB41Y]WLP89406.1 SGNH/GDSL hydrolase family protein [Gordonia sp. NB41Y]